MFFFSATPSLAKLWKKYAIQILGNEIEKKRRGSWVSKRTRSMSKIFGRMALSVAPVVFPKKELRHLFD